MESYIVYLSCFFMGAVTSCVILILFFNKIKSIINNDFIKLANNAVKSEQEDMRKQNREALAEKLEPLSKELSEVKSKVETFNISGVENTAKIVEQLNILAKNNKSIEQEAKNLTNALTKNQNIKGAYGEGILDTILQNCGMQEGIHYFKQYSAYSENLNDDTTHKIRPDIVINLPRGRHLIVDSKVTLKSYLDYINDNSRLKEFKAEVKKRINDLAQKNYSQAEGIEQPDFVLMYIPIESSLNILYEDSDIINYAYKSNIIIVGTASLLVAIRLVNQLFAQQKQNDNLKQIVKAGTNLYETFSQLCEELIQIQKDFDELSQQFTTAINRFRRSNKNKPSIFSQVNELKNLGISSQKEIPANLLEDFDNDFKHEVTIND